MSWYSWSLFSIFCTHFSIFNILIRMMIKTKQNIVRILPPDPLPTKQTRFGMTDEEMQESKRLNALKEEEINAKREYFKKIKNKLKSF